MEVIRLKEILKLRGRTSKWLSEQLNISQGYISDILRHKKTPSIETLIEISKALNVDIKDLFYGTKEITTTELIEKIQRDLERLKSMKS